MSRWRTRRSGDIRHAALPWLKVVKSVKCLLLLSSLFTQLVGMIEALSCDSKQQLTLQSGLVNRTVAATKQIAQVISPTACGALFSARTTPQPSQWNPRGTLVEPWWNPRGTLPQGRPGPPWSLSGLRQAETKLSAGGKKPKDGHSNESKNN